MRNNILRKRFRPTATWILLLCFFFSPVVLLAQSDSIEKVVIFPSPMKYENWRASIGFSFLTTPEDIAEEARLRVPAGELIVLRKIDEHFNLAGTLTFQVLQNHLTFGGRWVHKQTDHIYFSVGDDIGYWFGFLNVGGFDSKAHGWMNYLHASLGLKLDKELWLTLKGESSFNLSFKASNGENVISSDKNVYNGEAFTVALEQPFFHKKHLSLSLTGYYNYFHWETWSLFYRLKRKIFYPQIKVGFIL
ncbi:MAG TPA: hypothetical protein VFL47_01165 [Flavisolibacter sp.]|nr:hypothetical protein [Flavisolibacter sp.]